MRPRFHRHERRLHPKAHYRRQVTAQAEFSIMRFDFGIKYAGPADNLIRDEVVIKFDVTAVPADA